MRYNALKDAFVRFMGMPSPAQRPEPGQVVRVVHAVANCDDFMEAFDLNTEDLYRETHISRDETTGKSGLCV